MAGNICQCFLRLAWSVSTPRPCAKKASHTAPRRAIPVPPHRTFFIEHKADHCRPPLITLRGSPLLLGLSMPSWPGPIYTGDTRPHGTFFHVPGSCWPLHELLFSLPYLSLPLHHWASMATSQNHLGKTCDLDGAHYAGLLGAPHEVSVSQSVVRDPGGPRTPFRGSVMSKLFP